MNRLTFISEALLEQGSDPWLRRRGIVGTSTQSSCVMGEPLDYKDSVRTWRELRTERAFGSAFGGNLDTERGKRLEPLARDLFNNLYEGIIAPVYPIWCERWLIENEYEGPSIVHWPEGGLPPILGPTMASSYDGYSRNGDFHAWVEVKCPRDKRSKVWKSVEKKRIPDDYYWQVVHQRATFGDHDAYGYFMVYLNDEDYLVMAVDEDERVTSGQFARDVQRACQEWIKFLSGELQPGDMSMNIDWSDLEKDLTENRNKRLDIEVKAKPFGDAEERSKRKLKDMIGKGVDAPGLPHIYGRLLSFDNRPTRSFNLDEFQKTHPDFDLSDYKVVTTSFDYDAFKEANQGLDLSDYETATISVDIDRLTKERPEFLTIKDSWYINVRE